MLQRLVPVGAGQEEPGRGKTAAGTAKTRSAPKKGSAKSGLARGYRLTFVMTGLGWGRGVWRCNKKIIFAVVFSNRTIFYILK